MADKRVDLNPPLGSTAVVSVPEDQVQQYEDAGWARAGSTTRKTTTRKASSSEK